MAFTSLTPFANALLHRPASPEALARREARIAWLGQNPGGRLAAMGVTPAVVQAARDYMDSPRC